MGAEGCYVPSMSLDPIIDEKLSNGACRLLTLLRARCGAQRWLQTLTKSLATTLGVCVNTIRTWRNYLVGANYIGWTLNRRTGIITVTLGEKVETPSRRAAMHAEDQRADTSSPIAVAFAALRAALRAGASRLTQAPGRLAWPRMPETSKACHGGAQYNASIKPRISNLLPSFRMPGISQGPTMTKNEMLDEHARYCRSKGYKVDW